MPAGRPSDYDPVYCDKAEKPKRKSFGKGKTEQELGFTRKIYRGGHRASRMRKFGITPEFYDFMLEYQGHSCGICRKPAAELSRRLAVDHCHATGRVRGLLCGNCNTALGMFKDSRESLRRAERWIMTDEELGIPTATNLLENNQDATDG